MSAWTVKFDDELEREGYRCLWMPTGLYDVYDKRNQPIAQSCRDIYEARHLALDHFRKVSQPEFDAETKYAELEQRIQQLEKLMEVKK